MKNFNKLIYILSIIFISITFLYSCSNQSEIEIENKNEDILDSPILSEPQINDVDSVGDPEIIEDVIEPQKPTLQLPLDTEKENEDKIEIQPQTPQIVEKQYILVKTDNLNVRSGSSTKNSIICSFNKGDMLGYFGKENGWYITYVKGKKAYVSANTKYTQICTLNSSDDKVEKIIDIGLKYLGTPYVYGAVRYHDGNGNKLKNFTDSQFDCSSYMQYIFYKGGNVLLGLTTRNQVLEGKHVEKKDLKRGDLIFFTNSSRVNKKGIERVGHVALYLGDNYILHTASDYAVIEQISNQRWGYYIEARRFV